MGSNSRGDPARDAGGQITVTSAPGRDSFWIAFCETLFRSLAELVRLCLSPRFDEFVE